MIFYVYIHIIYTYFIMHTYNILIISYILNVADIRINIHLQTKLGAFIFINTKLSTMYIYKYKSLLLNIIYILKTLTCVSKFKMINQYLNKY